MAKSNSTNLPALDQIFGTQLPEHLLRLYGSLIFKQYLKALDPGLLRQRIGRFWEHDFAGMSHREVADAIYKVLMINGSFVFPLRVRTIPPGTQLLRVRHVPRDFVPTEWDCWAPPKDKARNNRLNRDGEP